MTGPSADEVSRWIAGAEAEIKDLRTRIEPLLEQEAKLNERLGILQRLRASLTSTSADGAAPPEGAASSAYGSVRERVHAQALLILRESGKSMHITNVRNEFVKRGFEVPGAGHPNNITAHLSGWKDIDSPTRGYYRARG